MDQVATLTDGEAAPANGRPKRSERIAAAAQRDLRADFASMATQLRSCFIRRDDAIDCALYALLTGQHYLLVGGPGTAKTAVADAIAKHFPQASYFSELMGSFTTEDTIFGALDIAAFKAGHMQRVLDDGKRPRLAAVELAFLDEAFKTNDGALNGCLGALNERRYAGQHIPLRTCGAATNWPELESRSEKVAALYDRFLWRCEVEGLTEEADVVAMLGAVERVEGYRPQVTFTIEELDRAVQEVKQVQVGPAVRGVLYKVRKRLLDEGVEISDRRLGQLQAGLRASAWLGGRTQAGIEDFAAIRFGLWNERGEQSKAVAVLDTIDAEVVKELIKKIDDVRKNYNDAVAHGRLGGTAASALIADMKAVAVAVKTRLDEPIVTERGKRDVAKAMRELKQNFGELKDRVEKAAAK
jgi:MoxR-like ATPase